MSEKSAVTPRSSGFSGVFKTLTKSLKPASGRVPVVVNAKVVGGTADMNKLMKILSHGSLSSKVSAASEITRVLRDYSISSVPEIWYLARPLCDPKNPPTVRKVAIKLMIQCIEHDEDAVSNTLMYFRDICMFCKLRTSEMDSELPLFLDAIRSLTADGKNLHDLCLYSSDQNWFDFMKIALQQIVLTTDPKKKQKWSSSNDTQTVVKLCQYLKNCIKFNFPIMEQQFISSTVNSLLMLTTFSENLEILQSVGVLVQAIIVFSFVPIESYSSSISLLCWQSSVSPELHSLSLDCMSKMFLASPICAIESIMSILQNPELEEFKGHDIDYTDLKQNSPHRSILTSLGALSLLKDILTLCDSAEAGAGVEICFEPFYRGLIHCVSLKIPLLNSGVLRMFDHVFLDTENGNSSFSSKAYAALFPFYSWYTSSNSIFTLLSKSMLNSAQDRSYWNSICSSINERYCRGDLKAPRERLIELYLLHPDCIDLSTVEFVIDYYKQENLCVSLNPSWQKNCKTILHAFYFTNKEGMMPTKIRINSLDLIKNAFEKSASLTGDETPAKQNLIAILKISYRDTDFAIIKYVLETMIHDFVRGFSISSIKAVFDCLFELLNSNSNNSSFDKFSQASSYEYNSKTLNHSLRTAISGELESSQKFVNELSKLLCRLLVSLSTEDYQKTKVLYDFGLDILNFTLDNKWFKISLVYLRVFFRLRCTTDGYIYFCEPMDVNGLATTLKRNVLDESCDDISKTWWHYPEDLDFLPSRGYSRANSLPSMKHRELVGNEIRSDIDVVDTSKWIEVVISILEKGIHWELYCYTLVYLCSQLSNMNLFANLQDYVIKIQSIVCDQLRLNFPEGLSFPLQGSLVKKSDLQVAHIRTMSALIGYHKLFSKQAQDNLVNSLLFSLGSWHKTAVPCIHMLTTCCYEIPESLKRYLIPILAKLQTGFSHLLASTSTLEFLLALIHVPSLTSNFTTDEFKQVFAIAFRYIEHALDPKKRKFNDEENVIDWRINIHGTDQEVDSKTSTQATQVTPVLYQYLLTVSYSIIIRWFLKIDLSERSRVSSFIVKNFIACSGSKSIENLDDMTVAYLDAISRFTYSNIPLKIVTKPSPVENMRTNRWLVGHAIVEISTRLQDGKSKIIVRRPSGFAAFDLELNADMIPSTLSQNTREGTILGSYLLLQLFKPLDQANVSKPIALLDDAFTERAVNSFDRIPVVANHKAGVVYIGPYQKEEGEILANTVGSADYEKFLMGLGRLIRLDSSADAYVGGLDTTHGTDGEFAYFWSDELTHLIFHTTTLMPNMANDKYYASKKRHIGNNYVNIYFDESELPFNFNIIKSQFNFLNITISPHTVGYPKSGVSYSKFYKVRIYRRSGVPGIFSMSHFKLISLEQLPNLIRTTVIVANQFADVWHDSVNGKYTTSWQTRVQHINTLRKKTLEMRLQMQEELARAKSNSRTGPSRDTAKSFLEQLQPTESIPEAEQIYENTFGSDTRRDEDLYSLLEFNSYT